MNAPAPEQPAREADDPDGLYDVIVLGAGTWLFKTADRVRTFSAGMVGFRIPAGLDDEGRDRKSVV